MTPSLSGLAEGKGVGQTFETLLIGQLLKVMRGTLQKSAFSDSQSGVSHYLEMVDLELARLLVERGGLGLAAQLERRQPAGPTQSHGQEKADSVLRSGRLTSPMGWRSDPLEGKRRFHRGIDLAAPQGTPVRSLSGGRVVSVGWAGGYGRRVVVEGKDGLRTLYAHLNRIHVRAGEKIAAGSRLGDVGRSGRATGAHLHLEMKRNGRLLNPLAEVEFVKAAAESHRQALNKVTSSRADKMDEARAEDFR